MEAKWQIRLKPVQARYVTLGLENSVSRPLHLAHVWIYGYRGLEHDRVEKSEKRLAQVSDEPTPEADGVSSRVCPPMAVAPFNEKTAKLHQVAWARYPSMPVVQTTSIGMKLVLIPPGSFDMGSTEQQVSQLLEEAKRQNAPAWYIGRIPCQVPNIVSRSPDRSTWACTR